MTNTQATIATELLNTTKPDNWFEAIADVNMELTSDTAQASDDPIVFIDGSTMWNDYGAWVAKGVEPLAAHALHRYERMTDGLILDELDEAQADGNDMLCLAAEVVGEWVSNRVAFTFADGSVLAWDGQGFEVTA